MRTAFALNAILVVCAVCSAQTNPQNVPQPPQADQQPTPQQSPTAKPDLREKDVSQLVQAQFVERPLITGRQAMVTSLQPLASMAGMRILQEGGNAFDAAVGAAIAFTVVDPRMSSIGGNGFATVYVAKTHEVRALNFYGAAPKHATADAYEGKDYSHGILSVPVPSCLRGYETLHKAYGRLPWAKVLEPAIELAENGFVVTQKLSDFIRLYQTDLGQQETARALLPGGHAPKAGDILKQPDLARTLRGVAQFGSDYFYRGPVAARIAQFFRKNGGVLTEEDLADYRAKWVTPVSTTYREYTIYTQPPSSSALAVLEQLNMLEGYDLKSLGQNSPEYLHLIGEVMRLAIADRNRYVGDPDFVHVPVDELISKPYASERRKLIHLDSTMSVATAGDANRPEETHTTHLNVVDEEGNMVALTQTLGDIFGSTIMAADTGVLLSDEMRHLHLDPNDPSFLEPGKRPRSNESPIIILKDGKPYMAIGAPGSDGIWQNLVQVIVNVIDFGMDIQTAITAPRMRSGGSIETGTEIKPTFVVENRIPSTAINALRVKGYEIHGVPNIGVLVNGIVIDPVTGFKLGGADPRAEGYALAW